MMRLFLAMVAVLALSEVAPARAQFVAGAVPPFGYTSGYSYSYRSALGFPVGGPRLRLGGISGVLIGRPAFYGPPIVLAYNPFAPVVVGFGGFGGPFIGGWGSGFGPPVIVVPVPVPVVVGPPPDNPNLGGNAMLFPKGTKESDFVVITPKKEPVPLPLPLPLPKKAKLPKAPAPFKPAVPVKAEVADPDPKKEAARLVKLGLVSFADGDYGRAAEFFDRATTADPADARAYFLLGQAKFASGQFADAATRIREGLARDPKWPLAAFSPPDLYGDRPERFFVHLLALKKAVADNPNQATLEFLLGYQLWFTGEKAAADKLFRAAEKRLPAPGPIALFKLP